MSRTTAWDLFKNTFKQGDFVIIVTDNDKFYWGSMAYDEENCYLGRPGRRVELIPWNSVRFIANDGFPIRELCGADGSISIEQMDTAAIQEKIHKELVSETESLCVYDVNYQKVIKRFRNVRFGDPYDIEGVRPILLKEGPWCGLKKPWNNPNAECLHLIAPGGAVGQLYSLESVYMFE